MTEEVISPEPSRGSTLREEPIQETEGEESESPLIESDSEGLVMARKPSKRKQKAMPKPVGCKFLLLLTLFGWHHVKMYLRAYADNEGPDQPVHSRSLIRAFTVR